jgi:hypothetical protein
MTAGGSMLGSNKPISESSKATASSNDVAQKDFAKNQSHTGLAL